MQVCQTTKHVRDIYQEVHELMYPRLCVTRGICCFSINHAALRRKSKDWLAQNQDNVSELGDMSILGLLFQWASAG